MSLLRPEKIDWTTHAPSTSIQIVADCGCIWEHQPGWEGWWRLRGRCAMPYVRHRTSFYASDLPVQTQDAVRVGYAIAASMGVGPWAKDFPKRRTA